MWGTRLREERKRLGKSQTEVAKTTGISRPTQSGYENGEGNPSGTYWESISRMGFDIQYIATGTRSKNLEEVAIAHHQPLVEIEPKDELLDTLKLLRREVEKAISLVEKRKKL